MTADKKQREPENKIQIRKSTVMQFRITCSLNDKRKVEVMNIINFTQRRPTNLTVVKCLTDILADIEQSE